MTNCTSELRRASVAGPARMVLAVLGIAGIALTASRPAAAQQAGREQQKPPPISNVKFSSQRFFDSDSKSNPLHSSQR